jgi:O-antigen/teichoic acid export membrane protein
MVYFDRFVIGAIIGMAAVAHYTTPYELVTRLWIIPDALFGVIFTALAMSLATDRQRAARIYDASARALWVGMSIPIALTVLFAPEGLELWLGPVFATKSTSVLRWLAIGVFINTFARLPFAALQASGRPDLTAKLHLAELPIYLFLLWTLTTTHGIVGAAAAWMLRIIGDTLMLFVIGFVKLPALRRCQMRALALAGLGGLGLAFLTVLDGGDLKPATGILILASGLALVSREWKAVRLLFLPPRALPRG